MSNLSLDAAGVYGEILNYTIMAFFALSAFIIFLFLWYKGRLDMDESPKLHMLEDEIKEKDLYG